MKRSINLFAFFLGWVFAGNAQTGFQIPSYDILALAEYVRAPSIKLDKQKDYAIYSYRHTYKSLNDLNQPEIRLGGLRINPRRRVSSNLSYFYTLKVHRISENKNYPLQGLPSNPRICYGSFSPDESSYVFCNVSDSGIALFTLYLTTQIVKQITPYMLNASMGKPYEWIDNNHLFVYHLPAKPLTLIDSKEELPTGPTIATGEGTTAQNRTYADLLKNPQDEVNFDRLIESEIKIVSLRGAIRDYLPADKYIGISASPNRKMALATTIQKPYSYVVPYIRFPQTSIVYDMEGRRIDTIAKIPLAENIPKGFSSTRKGKRNISWRPDRDASIFYVEALDEGNAASKVGHRDALYSFDAPFKEEPKLLMKTHQRFANIHFSLDSNILVEDMWYDTRRTMLYHIIESEEGCRHKLVWERNYQDKYSDPGDFQYQKNENGRDVLAIKNNHVFLIGDGYTDDGQYPFISKLNLKTYKTGKIYTSKLFMKKEDILEIIDYDAMKVLVMIQSPKDYPNYYFRTIGSNKLTQITEFENPFITLEGVSKEVIKYKRKDGLPLSGTLYFPKNMSSKSKIPLLIWAYPEEFKDKKSAGQNTKNEYSFTFPNPNSFVYWVAKGYAVLDDASFPIVGEDSIEPNDNFISQLVMNAEAAIDAADRTGYIDRTKCAIGGHSYGAFMTANLLTHTNLFACGVARSGAYNRTLTPFGFQSEQRNYWDNPKLYNTMSPFMNADKMKTPLLLVHGEADNNPGTFTLQTERYFQALKGLGAPVRMVLLPKESHGYVAKENILHLLWEQDQWFEKYLKKPVKK